MWSSEIGEKEHPKMLWSQWEDGEWRDCEKGASDWQKLQMREVGHLGSVGIGWGSTFSKRGTDVGEELE